MWLFSRKGPSGFSACNTAEEVTHGIDGTNLTAIVTGASRGIGFETARVLALRGVHVIVAVRNTAAGWDVKEAIVKETPAAKVDVMELDLSSMASVRRFASEFNSLGLPLNILINNAGIMSDFMLTQDNVELVFATNHLGHFLLTDLLLENMKSTARQSNIEGRIINVSSEGYRFSYREGIRFDKINDRSGFKSLYAYFQSKLANILHAKELARRLKEDGVQITANSLHPGSILTDSWKKSCFLNGKSLNDSGLLITGHGLWGASTTCYVALHLNVKGVSGEYFMDNNISKANSQAKDTELAKKLWDLSMNLIH
ncbi:Short-chain dehydrogenase/reductase SDR [Macleaya cordata]|uniref:Short-chain dehydrogenase/reductase SDR n=1 Tax=Macleaya cordata TaxID=56857 RepID=A0A200QU48_MACCD|nr:Short-chain dehydrogenase/reductase SDR [Macleaya cordata]